MKKRYLFIIWILALILSFFIDKWFIDFIIALRNPILDEFMKWISYIGTSVIILFIITALFLYEERKRRWILPLIMSALIALLFSNIFKYVFMRSRPDVLQLVTETNPGFPSNHATVAFSTLPILNKEFPKIKLFWIVFVFLIAFSRIYLGVHYLSDVVAGGLLGYSISTLVLYIRRRLFKH